MSAVVMPDRQLDARIRAIYTGGSIRGQVKRLALDAGCPARRISERAAQLGVRRTKEPRWTPEEEAIVEAALHLADSGIRRRLRKAGYSRTEMAIATRRQLLGLGLREGRAASGVYSANQLAARFGANHMVVLRWINLGILKARKRGTARTQAQNGDMWEIQEADVREALINYSAEFEAYRARADWYWLVDVLAGSSLAKQRPTVR